MGNGESLQVKDSPQQSRPQQLTYNGQRISRRWEDEYVDISPEVEAFSKEQMEDQFIKIVVRCDNGCMQHKIVQKGIILVLYVCMSLRLYL